MCFPRYTKEKVEEDDEADFNLEDDGEDNNLSK